MKIALLFSGLLTNNNGDHNVKFSGNHYLEQCFKQIKKHILDVNPNCIIDIYFYSWKSNNHDVDDKIIEDIINLYKPKKYKFTNEKENNRFLSKMKGNKLVFNLLEEEYDLCAFMRADVYINKNIEFSNYDLTKIYHNDGMPSQ